MLVFFFTVTVMACTETLVRTLRSPWSRTWVFPSTARVIPATSPFTPPKIRARASVDVAPPLAALARRNFSTTPFRCWEKPNQKGLDGLKFKEQREAKKLYEFNGRWILPLPDYQKAREIRAAAGARAGLQKLRREGMLPPRSFNERPIDVTSTFAVHEPYVPPEGDGAKTFLSKEGAAEKKQRAQMWAKTKNAFRKINKIEKDIGGFDSSYFADEAVDLYVMAHEALVADDPTRLHELVTSKCYQELTHGLRFQTLRWSFHHNVEPPRAVHGAYFSTGPAGNNFAQVTVRIHSQQSVAIYDRFGRLAYGDPTLPRTVLEFVVFEKRVSDTYGAWRLHGKLEPEWLETRAPVKRTFRVPEHEEIQAEDLQKMEVEDMGTEEEGEDDGEGRKLVTA